MIKGSGGNDLGHNFYDISLNGVDDSVIPGILAYGTMGKDAAGAWHYTLVSGSDGAPIVHNSDAGLLRVSSIGGSTVSLSADASGNRVSALQMDASNLRLSAFNQDANLMHVSGFNPDASLFLISAKSGDANQVHVSGVQGDASLLRVSAFESVVSTNTGGASSLFVSSGATSQVSTLKSSPGRLYGYHIGNPAGVDQYLQIFNASGGATAGTDAPALSLYIPTLGGAVMSLGAGIGFSNGIQFIGTSTVNGQTIGASALRINLFYA